MSCLLTLSEIAGNIWPYIAGYLAYKKKEEILKYWDLLRSKDKEVKDMNAEIRSLASLLCDDCHPKARAVCCYSGIEPRPPQESGQSTEE